MPTTYAKIFDRVALSFFTALAMFPVLTVALGGVFH
jgi:nitrate reductase NapE component